MRYAGIGLVALSVTMTGFFLSELVRTRLYTVDSVLLFLSVLQNSMSFSLTPIAEAMGELKNEPSLYRLDFLTECAELCRRGEDFPFAWRKALDESRTLLKKRERDALILFGDSLSRTDSEGQKRLFDHYRSIFGEIREKAASDRRKYTALISAAGVLLSVLTAVILL